MATSCMAGVRAGCTSRRRATEPSNRPAGVWPGAARRRARRGGDGGSSSAAGPYVGGAALQVGGRGWQPLRAVGEEEEVGLEEGQEVAEEAGLTAVPGSVGWGTLVWMCTLSSVICTIDRAAMSVAILPMAAEFDWGESVKGAVSSAFFAGYTLTNFSGGFLTGVFPAASLLGVGVLLWSGFTVLTPPAAASRSMPVLMGVRAAMGVSEGVAFPSYTALYAKHMPKEKRSMAQALLYSGQQLGTIIALLAAPKVPPSPLSWRAPMPSLPDLRCDGTFSFLPISPAATHSSRFARA